MNHAKVAARLRLSAPSMAHLSDEALICRFADTYVIAFADLAVSFGELCDALRKTFSRRTDTGDSE